MSILADYEKILKIESELKVLKNQINKENKRLKLKVNMLLDKINKASFWQRLRYLLTKKL